jgi:predicted dehydrogenase
MIQNPSMRLAIVGCGYVADLYARTLFEHRELEVTGVMDRDRERAEQFAAFHKVPRYPTLQAVLDDPDVELVLNLTNPRSHFEVTNACLRAGKHVYSEKPLAMSTADARALADLARERRLHLSAAPSRLLGEPAQTAWKALRDGAIGRPRLVYAEMDDGPVHLMDYREWKGASGAPWPYRDELETGCTLEHSGYVLTWLAAFFGPAESVAAFSTLLVPDKGIEEVTEERMAPDFSVACIRYAAGVVARLTCSIVAPADHRLRIVGDTGVLAVEDCWTPQSPVTLARHLVEGRWRHDPIQTTLALATNPRAPRAARTLKKVDFCLGPAELAHAVREGRRSRLSADLACHITELALAIQQAREGAPAVKLTTSFDPIEPMPWAR